MAARRLAYVVGHFKSLLAVPTSDDGGDRQLLEQFALQQDEAAFAALVRQHGPLVLGVSRRILHHEQDAEDVFQATFLILARKAAASGWQKSIAGWLYRVAYRLATRTRANISRRRDVESKAAVRAAQSAGAEDRLQLYAILDEELHRLGRDCREAILLCYLEGKTRDQAATQLGWSLRTLERRLEQGLKLLRARLSRRGVELPIALLAAGLSQQAASAAVSAHKVAAVVAAAKTFTTGAAVGTALSARAVALAEGGLRVMTLTKIAIGAVSILAVTLLTAVGVGALAQQAPKPQQAKDSPAVQKKDEPPPQKAPAASPVTWPEGAVVQGRVVDQRGNAVADAEVILLGKDRIIVNGHMTNAKKPAWFVPDNPNKRPDPPSTRTGKDGTFRLVQKKGSADRLAIIADDPLFWVVFRKDLPASDGAEIKLPAGGDIAIHCDLPGKPAKHEVEIDWIGARLTRSDTDLFRFHFSEAFVINPGDAVFKHLPPGNFEVTRIIYTPTGKSSLMDPADLQRVKVEQGRRAEVRFERKIGRPLQGQVRGLEKVELSYALVTIHYAGPLERRPDDPPMRLTAFDVIPIGPDGKFTTDPIAPGKYMIWVSAVDAALPEQSNQEDFTGQTHFTVPEKGDMPKVEFVAKRIAQKDREPNTDYRAAMTDDAGKPIAKFEATIQGRIHWVKGRQGTVNLGSPSSFTFQEPGSLDVVARADGYASTVARFAGRDRAKLATGQAKITMKPGQKVELQFRLPKGLAWPDKFMPEVYFSAFEDDVSIMRQPSNRGRGHDPDFNMLNARPLGAGRFGFRLGDDTPPFNVAIHAPGFLQYFVVGPFTLADVKQGVLAIDVPLPAALDIHFDPTAQDPADRFFKGVSFMVMRQILGDTYLEVATSNAEAVHHELKLTDLAPGVYMTNVYTQPRVENKKGQEDGINPGAFRDTKQLALKAGATERIDFRYQPFDPNAFRGDRTAVVRIRVPEGGPGKKRQARIEFYDGHYGGLPVFVGPIPESGVLTLKGLTDRRVRSDDTKPYSVSVDGKRLGSFGFAKDGPEQEFEFHLPPGVGDMAPDIELRRLATGETIKLSSLRGKVVCLEFWATWCGPCQPAMTKMSEMFAERGPAWKDRVAIVPLSIDAESGRVKSHAAQRGWEGLDHFWSADGPATGWESPAARAFVVGGVPEIILIAPNSRILWRGHPEDKRGGDLKSRIEAELKK